jgi:hypothetical protein
MAIYCPVGEGDGEGGTNRETGERAWGALGGECARRDFSVRLSEVGSTLDNLQGATVLVYPSGAGQALSFRS